MTRITGISSLFGVSFIRNDLVVTQIPYKLFAWGNNGSGRLGISTASNTSSPVQVGLLEDWKQINAGNEQSLAVKNDGTLWGWGKNLQHRLALPNQGTNYSSPVQVGTSSDWKFVNNRGPHTMALRSNYTLWAWGSNGAGRLGLGDVNSRSSPVQVGSSTWKLARTTYTFTHAIRSDNTLWAWGYNLYGRLGLNDTVSRSSPVQIGTGNDWAWLAFNGSFGGQGSLALKTNGTLWAWGPNSSGQLGVGDTTLRSSPVQVGTSAWKYVDTSGSHAIGIRTDGTLWSWGYNGFGQLGLGNAGAGTSRSSPVQIGSDNDWYFALACGGSSMAVKTNGTLWTWGRNNSGQLGLGNTTNRSSPVQVGSNTNWNLSKYGLAGYYHMLAFTQ